MWQPVHDNIVGIVIYPFHGTETVPSPYGIDLDFGEKIFVVADNCAGWLLGRTRHGSKLCIVPSSYIHRKSALDPTSEVTTVVREWGELWKKFFTEGHDYQEHVIRSGISELIEGRQQLLNGNLTKEQYEEARLKLANKIDWGNRKLGLDLVPRDGYKVIDGGEGTGVVKLYEHHVKSRENAEAARTTLRKKKSTSVHEIAGGHHLLMTVRDFNCNIGEECEIYFSVYDGTRGNFITERHETTLPSSNSVFIDRIQTISTLFTDLCNTDLNSDLYLVTHVLRVGRMFSNDSGTKKSTHNYRRPYACGVLNLRTSILNPDSSNSQENEYNFRLHNCDEKEFWQIHELIIKGSSKVTALSSSITVSVRVFNGDIQKVRDENLILFKNVVPTDKIGFPDVIMPGVVRNDLYVTVLHGEFEKSGKTMGGKNISVTVLALDSNGNNIENGVWSAVNLPNYESIILYHNNNPKWHETIKVKIPIEKFPDVHLRIEFRHCSTKEKNEKKLFGFSFMKLMDSEGTIVKDSVHTLPIYKCEENYKVHPSNYLSSSTMFQKSLKESVAISTHLVSTKLTQNMDLVSLLKWKSQPEKVKQTLVNIPKLPGEEIVKFLQDVLDVLFAMFISEEGSNTEYSEDAFVVLLHIFTLLEGSKFEHFKPVIDAYVQNHFAAALVYKGILSTLTHYTAVVHKLDKERMTKLKDSFRTADYIFKFTVQSQILFSRATGGHMEDSFRRDIQDMFEAFKALLAFESKTDEVVPTQSALLLNLSKIYTNLSKVLPLPSIADFMVELFRSIPLFQSAHKLSPSKLTALCHLVDSDLFKQKACRTKILPEICKHIRHHLSIRDELKLTSDILLAVLKSLQEERSDKNHDDVEVIATNVLEPLINAVLILERSSSIITPLVVSLIALYQQMTEYIYNRYFDEFKDLSQIRSFILRSLYVFRDLIKFNVFNDDWFKMKLLVNSNILKAMNSYSNIITSYFLKPNYDADLFLEYFNVCFNFILQNCLQLETFREDKTSWILREYEDMRVRMAKEVLNVWNCIEDRVQFAPSLISHVLLVSLLPLNQLAVLILPLIIDLIDAQFLYYGNFHAVEAELIDKLDTYIMEYKGDENYVDTFDTILSRRLEALRPPWFQAGQHLISSIKSLLEILIDYRAIPSDADNKDKKMNCINNLLAFYKNVNLKQMYIKYIYKLHDLHVSSDNYTEAGFTLLLHAELIDFKTDYVFKEDLHLRAIKYFDQGKLWERGIPICKELTNIYEKNFEYTKLSNIHVTMSTYFNNILSQHRPVPEYFRVSFIGLGFPLFVRNKEFVYRGLEYERITSFVQRIVAEWPDAEVLKHLSTDSNLINSDRQYLFIRTVKPLPNFPLSHENAPPRIKSYFTWNSISRFQYDHVLSKNLEDVSSIWIERTILETTNSFPGILRFFLVKSKVTTVLSPIKFAVEKVAEVNRNLEEILVTFNETTGGAINVNPLSMRLQGILDANVQGGLPKYQEAFFTHEFLANNPDSVEDVNNLNREILNQIGILDRALIVHGSIIPPGVQPLHNRLVECFNVMKSNFEGVSVPPPLKRSDSLRVCSSIVNTPLPPVPTNNAQVVQQHSNNSNRTSTTSSNYGYINTSLNSEDEDFYSIPTDQPPPIPNRKKKLALIEQQQEKIEKPPPLPTALPPLIEKLPEKYNKDGKILLPDQVSNSSNEYIVMPPSRLRELNSTPPRPPKNEDHLNGCKTPPPVPPKPYSNRDSSGTSTTGDRRSTNSNSSTSNSSYKEYYVLPVKK